MTNFVTQFMPGFAEGVNQLQQAMIWVSMILCVAGICGRVFPSISHQELGMLMARLVIVVLLISHITEIGTDINNIATGIMNAPGFNQNLNMVTDYQTALATKFKIINQPGNNNPGQWLMGGIDMIGPVVFGTFIYGGSMIACGMMLAVQGFQQVLFLLEIALSPMCLGCIMIRPLLPIATRWATFFVAICLSPLGFRIVDLAMKGAIDMAVNTSGNATVTAANAVGGSVFWWIFVAVLGFFGYPLAGLFIGWSVVSSGSHGLGVVKAALASMAASSFGMWAMSARVGGAAARMMSQGSPSSIPRPYRNYALRP